MKGNREEGVGPPETEGERIMCSCGHILLKRKIKTVLLYN